MKDTTGEWESTKSKGMSWDMSQGDLSGTHSKGGAWYQEEPSEGFRC